MMPSSTTRAAILALAATLTGHAATTRTAPSRPAVSAWDKAQHLREALAAEPESSRTRAEYTHAIDAFRTIYFGSPRDQHAPASILAQANLEAEEGHLLHDAKATQAAATHYEFLRTQYPGSSLVPQAILGQAQLEHDPKAAKSLYTLLIHNFPHSEEAKAARASMLAPATSARVKPSTAAEQPVESAPRQTSPDPAPVETAQAPPRHSGLPPMATTAELARLPDTVPAIAQPRATDLPVAATPVSTPVPTHAPKAAVVTGIRHWSTTTYTRVAIDLGDNVTFEAARVPNPSRLFFDIHGARLAPELINKTFTITDDGFLQTIRAAQSTPDTTRVVLDVSDVTEYSAFLLPNPTRLIIDIHGKPRQAASIQPAPMPSATPATVPSPRVAQPQPVTLTRPVPNATAEKTPSTTAEISAISSQPGKVEATARPTTHPIAATVSDDTQPLSKKKKSSKSEPAAPAKAAVPTAEGETSLVRALGLKINRIVIDAGHGGHDSGTLGVGGIQEKDVVLDVALRLGKLLHERLGAEIIYTRSDDTFIPLETRTAIANKAQADLFLSIHANSSPDATARGVETYYLNFTQSADALRVASRENAVSGQSVHDLSDLVKKIALKDKIDESREFASDVEQSLYGGLTAGNDGLRNRGVKKAPFIVLIGANMPSILAEISFVTNQRDAEQLRKPDYRQRIAESLFKGVAKYQAGLGDAHPPLERASIATAATGK